MIGDSSPSEAPTPGGRERRATERVVTDRHRMTRVFFDRRTGQTARRISELPGPRELDPASLEVYLFIGYVPGDRTLWRDVRCLPGGATLELSPPEDGVPAGYRVVDRDSVPPSPRPMDAATLVHRGHEALKSAVEGTLAAAQGPLLLPLSGGVDSRLLLGHLLTFLRPSEIHTLTYGVPGALDFEIGRAVAAKVGTRHSEIDMRQLRYDEETLVVAARWADANTNVVQPAVWVDIARQLGTDWTVVSGFAGDAIGGSFYAPAIQGTDTAVEGYVDFAGRALNGHEGETARRTAEEMLETETIFDDVLGRREAIWFASHVERYTGHQVFLGDWNIAAPFMDKTVTDLWLGAPPELRQGKQAFHRMATVGFPALFELPTRSSGYGLSPAVGAMGRHWAWVTRERTKRALYRLAPGFFVHPQTGYMDYDVAYRRRPDLRRTAESMIHALERRRIIPDGLATDVWRRHQSGERRASMVGTLITLEAALRAHGTA